MKNLKEVKFDKIEPKESYIVMAQEYERYGPSEDPIPMIATGTECIELLKEKCYYEDWLNGDYDDKVREDTPEGLTKFLKEVLKRGLLDEEMFYVYGFPTAKK